MAEHAKHDLGELLAKEAFQPVLDAGPEGLSGSRRQVLEHVQGATRAEIDRYRHYGFAEEVYANFHRGLTSASAKKVHAELRRLSLPTFEDVREAFEARAEPLGVARG